MHKGNHVVEVGPGPGGITRAAFEAGARHVAVIEKDSRFLPGLQVFFERLFHVTISTSMFLFIL